MRIDFSPCQFTSLLLITLVIGVLAAGCVPDGEDQSLIATGELVAADGQTPLANTKIDRYMLTFSLIGDAGNEIDIRREYLYDGDGGAIVTNANGMFRIKSSNLALSYDWQQDEYLCENVCVSWDTFCYDIKEEVCDTCIEDDCWDDCTKECTEECRDEEVCDENGDCWTETVCSTECSDVCQTVCEPVKYDCNCRVEVYEQCDDECIQTAEQCEWVTQTYTSYPSLDEITKTEARVWIKNDAGDQKIIAGEQDRDRTGLSCDADGKCDLTRWLQHDRFVMPPATNALDSTDNRD